MKKDEHVIVVLALFAVLLIASFSMLVINGLIIGSEKGMDDSFIRLSDTQSSGNIYYVSISGNDNNIGTQTLPFRTIKKCANVAVAGDTCDVADGIYNGTVILNNSGNYVDGNITIKAHNNGKVIVLTGVTPNAFSSPYAFDTTGRSYITIEGFNITGNGSYEYNQGGILIGGNYINVYNNYIYSLPGTAVGPWTSGNYQHVDIENNKFYKNNDDVSIFGQYWVVKNNDFDHLYDFKSENVSYFGQDSNHLSVFGSGHLIQHNYIHESNYSIFNEAELLVVNGSPVTCTQESDCSVYGGQYDCPLVVGVNDNKCRFFVHDDVFQTFNNNGYTLNNTIFDGNFVWFNKNFLQFEGNQTSHVNNTFSNNVIVNGNGSGLASIAFVYGGANNRFFNNIFVGGTWINILASKDGNESTTANVSNNIFYQAVGYWADPATGCNASGGNNTLYNSETTLTYQSNPTDMMNLDPVLLNGSNPLGNDNIPFTSDDGLQLTASSASVDKGTDLSQYLTTDILGIPRPQGSAWDIGAYEYVSGTPLNPADINGDRIISSFESLNYTLYYKKQLTWPVAPNPIDASNWLFQRLLFKRGGNYTIIGSGCPPSGPGNCWNVA